MSTAFKCRDCGGANGHSGAAISPKQSRADVCGECWEIRLKIIRALKGKTISIDEFKEWQGMQRGTRTRLARKLLGLSQPPTGKE